MAAMGRTTLRDRFDEAPTPHIAHPPHTHHRDFYVATDGSFTTDGGGLGVIIETTDGELVARRAVTDHSPDNNVAEYRALHLGLDTLAARAPADVTVGVLLDHDDLAANVNAAVLTARSEDFRPFTEITHPPGIEHHWRGIRARIAGFEAVRAATVLSGDNPAHPLANAPERYAHVNRDSARRRISGTAGEPEAGGVPPPSRSDRHAGD
ncbi:MAG: ribonuclease H [Halanaeroarchaeum sp.]